MPGPLPPLLVTMGDPAGIGGEIIRAAWRDRARLALPPFAVLADPDWLAGEAGDRCAVDCIGTASDAAGSFDRAIPVLPLAGAAKGRPGAPCLDDAPLVIEAIARAVDLCLAGAARGMVTAPISKANLYAGGFTHAGHTEFIAARTGAEHAVMMLAGPSLRVVPATIHVPLASVPGLLTTANLVAVGDVVLAALQRDFGCASPRLVYAGLNPHAGENGTIGREDVEIIAPAVQALRALGHDVRGPLPADTLFHAAARQKWDAAICMYHDQALVPVKALDFDQAVNVTLGLPIVRTSPDHGTAFDIAGKGLARPESMIAAIRLADAIATRRAGE